MMKNITTTTNTINIRKEPIYYILICQNVYHQPAKNIDNNYKPMALQMQ